MLTNTPSNRKTLPAMKNTPIFRNPENIDPSTIPDGWRLTLPEEHELEYEEGPWLICNVPFKLWNTQTNRPYENPYKKGDNLAPNWTAITNAPLPEKYREKEIPWHNPNDVTQEQLEPEKGWRFLTVEEVVDREDPTEDIQGWGGNSFPPFQGRLFGANPTITYRVKWPLPAKYQKDKEVSENESEGILVLDEKYNQIQNKMCATVKEIERRGMFRFLIASRLVMADNPRHGNDPSFNWDSSITFQYGKSPTAELLETGEVKFHDGVKLKMKTVRYVQP